MYEQIELYVSNLPNNAPQKDIITYLETAGKIKEFRFNKDQQRCSVHVTYYDISSAQMAKRHLGSRQFMGRDLKINYDSKKSNLANVNISLNQLNQDQNLMKLIYELSPSETSTLMGYLSNLQKKQPKMFTAFLQTKPKLVQSLLRKNIQ